MKWIPILLIRLYQLTVSPLILMITGPGNGCRFEPTCSNYAIEAFKVHGFFYGGWLTLKRVIRCNPWGCCGYDPVPPKLNKAQD